MGRVNYVVRDLEKKNPICFSKKNCVIVTECCLLTFLVALIWYSAIYIYRVSVYTCIHGCINVLFIENEQYKIIRLYHLGVFIK